MEKQLLKQFETLRTAILNFARSVDSADNYWLPNWNSQSSDNDIESVLLDLWYLEDQDGRETRIYPGLVGLSRQQITYANEINLLKDRFRKSVNRLKDENNERWREIQQDLAKRFKLVNDHLTKEGLNRLHLKQVYRHLPLVIERPNKVGFSWYSSGRSIKRVTKAEAYQLLTKLNTESAHIKIQLDRLSGLPDHEPLARVQKQAPLLRANLVFGDQKRRSLNVSLPLFYPKEPREGLPEFNIPPETTPSERMRLTRSDIKIEEDAFLPSIRVHRYSQKNKPSFY